jgi:hypothetical protein
MALDTELKTALDSLQGETKRIFTDLATKHGDLETQYQALQKQVDAIDQPNFHRPGNIQKNILGEFSL